MSVTKSNIFYKPYSATANWASFDMGQVMNNVRLVAASGADIDFAFDIDPQTSGVLHGKLDDTDNEIVLNNIGTRKIFIKGSGDVRIYGWKSN